MQKKLAFSTLFLTLALSVSMGPAKSSGRSASASEIEHGRCLVEEVAKCGECHTPRDARGEMDHHAWLQGAPTWIMPVKPNPNWAYRAPALAGFPGLTDEQGERILEKGTGPQGEELRPPMHIYHIIKRMRKPSLPILRSLPQTPH